MGRSYVLLDRVVTSFNFWCGCLSLTTYTKIRGFSRRLRRRLAPAVRSIRLDNTLDPQLHYHGCVPPAVKAPRASTYFPECDRIVTVHSSTLHIIDCSIGENYFSPGFKTDCIISALLVALALDCSAVAAVVRKAARQSGRKCIIHHHQQSMTPS